MTLVLPMGEDANLQLPLSHDMEESVFRYFLAGVVNDFISSRFASLISTYEQLGQIVLFTIRLDVRCRVMYYLTTAMHHVSHASTTPGDCY